MKYLSNAFSINMMDIQHLSEVSVKFKHISLQDAMLMSKDATSIVGHSTTANIFSSTLQTKVDTNRISLQLKPNDSLIIGQYTGPRLEEGTTVLPDNASIKWYLVTL